MIASPPIDATAINSIREIGGDELLAKLIDLFRDYVGGRIAAAKTALQQGDITGVQDAVHPVKSSAANLGAQHVREIARQIEQLAKTGTVSPIPDRLHELEIAFAAASEALQKIRPAPPA
jgi:HPt (histidine-containing phosphotransfer) domain-containing protein